MGLEHELLGTVIQILATWGTTTDCPDLLVLFQAGIYLNLFIFLLMTGTMVAAGFLVAGAGYVFGAFLAWIFRLVARPSTITLATRWCNEFKSYNGSQSCNLMKKKYLWCRSLAHWLQHRSAYLEVVYLNPKRTQKLVLSTDAMMNQCIETLFPRLGWALNEAQRSIGLMLLLGEGSSPAKIFYHTWSLFQRFSPTWILDLIRLEQDHF